MTDRFAIRHAGLTVIPVRGKRRIPFESRAEAEKWARSNYRRGTLWEVIPLEPRPQSQPKKQTRPKNWDKLKGTMREIDAEATALFDEMNPDWETKTQVGKADCVELVRESRRKRRLRASQ